MVSRNSIKKKGETPLQTLFTVPNKALRDLNYVNKVKVLEETFKKECQDYPT